MSLQDLAVQAPDICKSRNADAYSFLINAAWEAEKSNKQSPFAAENHSGPWDRSKYWRIFEQDVPEEKRGVYNFIFAILQIADQLHSGIRCDIALVLQIKAVVNFYPEVSEVYDPMPLLDLAEAQSTSSDVVVAEVWN